MSARTSVRSANHRQHPSSPPKQQRERHSQTPVGRRTRSQSVETTDNNVAVTAGRRGKRNARQGSVDSDVSNATSTSSRQSRRKKPGNTAITYPDLSMVAEDGEAEESDDEIVAIEASQRSHSPGGMSQLSGTTARTSHSEAELQDLDSILVEFLPDLLGSSLKILDLLAPSEVVNNPDLVDTIVRDLKVLGSRRAKKLKHFEEKFKTDRDSFGTDLFIQVSLILEKVFGSADAPLGDFRPDALLYAANLTTLVKDLLVTQRENTDTYIHLLGLDTLFPGRFLSGFDDSAMFGNSSLLEQTFSVGLELRTQLAIAQMIHFKDHPTQVDPAKTLADCFFDGPDLFKNSLSYFDNLSLNGQVKDIMPAAPNTDDQILEIKARVERIRKSFRNGEDAREAGDVVDFEQLDERYPWQKFVAELVGWARLRLDEITGCIQKQGGVDKIVSSLIDTIKNNNSQVELEYDPPATIMAPRRLLPAADVQPSRSGTSFYNNKMSVLALEQMKRHASGEASSSKQNQQRPRHVVHSSNPTSSRIQAADASTVNPEQDYDDIDQGVEDGEGNIDEQQPRSSAEYVAASDRYSKDKNKENRPISRRGIPSTSKKPSIMDAQSNAIRQQWESQVEESSQEKPVGLQKRKHATQNEESGESEDEGFEEDQREHNFEGRVTKQPAPRRDPEPVRRTHAKRRRSASHDDDAADSERRNRAKAEEVLQRSARGPSADLDEEDQPSSDDERPNPTQLGHVANTATQKQKLRTMQTQTRTPWSDKDTDVLIDFIEKHGTSWSFIAQIARFERGAVDQVALRDKARNLKVNYLRAAIDLPVNFHKIALGKKEVEKVRTAIPDYELDM